MECRSSSFEWHNEPRFASPTDVDALSEESAASEADSQAEPSRKRPAVAALGELTDNYLLSEKPSRLQPKQIQIYQNRIIQQEFIELYPVTTAGVADHFHFRASACIASPSDSCQSLLEASSASDSEWNADSPTTTSTVDSKAEIDESDLPHEGEGLSGESAASEAGSQAEPSRKRSAAAAFSELSDDIDILPEVPSIMTTNFQLKPFKSQQQEFIVESEDLYSVSSAGVANHFHFRQSGCIASPSDPCRSLLEASSASDSDWNADSPATTTSDRSDSDDEYDLAHEDEDLSAASEADLTTADSYITNRKRSAHSAFGDDGMLSTLAPIVTKQIQAAIQPLITSVTTRYKCEEQHRQKMLAMEEEKLALMRQNLEFTRTMMIAARK